MVETEDTFVVTPHGATSITGAHQWLMMVDWAGSHHLFLGGIDLSTTAITVTRY